MSVERKSKIFPFWSISPYKEIGAYESLWSNPKTTFRLLAKHFAQQPESKPSDFVPEDQAQTCAQTVTKRFKNAGIERFGIMVHGSHEYSRTLRDPDYPVECIYYQGW
ncbi:MAG: hypothetical protein OXC62_00995 [Aestuariivita sp.]|nr:hypothetical protein [Aestuariivita sp.]